MKIRSILLYLLLIISTKFISAQTFNFQSIPNDKKQFGLTFDRPFYSDGIVDYSVSIYQIYINIPVSTKFNILTNVPFVHANYEFNATPYNSDFNFNKSGLGNIFVGLQTNPETVNNRKSVISFGLFLPTGDEEVAPIGLFPDYYNLQKYIPNSLGIYFNYAHHKIVDEGFEYGLEVGPNMSIPTEGESGEVELFLHYGLKAGVIVQKFSLNVELLGIGIITEDTEDFGDRFVHLVNFGAQWRGDLITPKIFYKIFLQDDLSDMFDGVLGLGVNIAID
jgi:hypothetical protein